MLVRRCGDGGVPVWRCGGVAVPVGARRPLDFIAKTRRVIAWRVTSSGIWMRSFLGGGGADLGGTWRALNPDDFCSASAPCTVPNLPLQWATHMQRPGCVPYPLRFQ